MRSAPAPRTGAGLWLPLLVALLTAAVFAPAIHNGFTNWDDPEYVLENQLLRDLSPSGIQSIATTFVDGNYHPLTVLSLALDFHASDLHPAGYHRTNIVLHVLATLAVYGLILLLTGSVELSAITSLFFGIHPLHVESVAWISGRKDLLYGLFYFLACGSYVLWVRRGQARYLAAALGCFLLSLLSKGMAVTLPLSLIAIDFYLRRVPSKRTWIEKAPFLVLSMIFGVIAILAQKKSVQEFSTYPWYERVLVAFHGIAAYLVRAVAPIDLPAFYPYPPGHAIPVTFFLAPLLTALLITGIVRSAKGDRTFAFGALFFLINIALVLQLVPVGSAALADRYTYVSYAGIGLVLAAGSRRLRGMGFARGQALGLAATVLVAGAFVAWMVAARERVKVWKDDVTLWTDVLARYPDLPMAYAHRAWFYQQDGARARAMADVERALAIDPRDGQALTTRGTLFYLSGDYERAFHDLDLAVRLRPGSASAVGNRGAVLLALEHPDAAIADFDHAIALNPWSTEAYLNRALAHGVKREYARVIPDLDVAIRYQPGNPQAFLWRGVAKLELGDPTGALADDDEALRLAPRFGEAYFARSNVYERMGRYDDALRDALLARAAGYAVSDTTIARLRHGQ